MRNKAFIAAFSDLTLPDEARERILTAAVEWEAKGPVRMSMRPIRVAAAAALTVCVLAGTALAVSPGLRELLWGGFEPYAQELEATPESVHIYDGVEARIVSALSDGHVNIIHVELWDLEGDRVRSAWERYQRTGVNEFADRVRFTSVIAGDGLPARADGSFSTGGGGAGLAARPVGFDEETGAITLRACLFYAALSASSAGRRWTSPPDSWARSPRRSAARPLTGTAGRSR